MNSFCTSQSTRTELASLLARVLHRLLTRQNLPTSRQDCLATTPETLLSVTKLVNTTGTHGDTR
ncbi:MAG: hypothetical protein U0796_19010 [Gemmatales bacterium]